MPSFPAWVLALAAAAAAAPAPPALSYAGRAARQQGFFEEYLKAHPPAAPLARPADLDRYLAGLEAAWAGSLDPPARRDPVLARLDPSVAVMAAMSVADPAQSWVSCHTWASHGVPRFLADFDVARSGPTAERAILLGMVTLLNVFNDQLATCDLPAAAWNRLVAAGGELPRLAEAYLAGRAYDGEKAGEALRQGRDHLLRRQPVITLADTLRRGDAAEARRQLAAGLAGKAGNRADVGQLGLELADLHLERRQPAEALAVLDLVARSTTALEVFEASLRERYARADPQGGRERLDRATAARLPLLAPTGERIQLAGRYTDLATGQTLDLASLAGKTVVLDFWTTWCTLCHVQVPQHNALLETYGKDGKLALIGIASDALSRGAKESVARELVLAKGMKYPNFYDPKEGSWTERLGVTGWPAHVLIAPDGSVLATPGSGFRTIPLLVVETYLSERAGRR